VNASPQQWRHSRESGNPFRLGLKKKMDPRIREDDGEQI